MKKYLFLFIILLMPFFSSLNAKSCEEGIKIIYDAMLDFQNKKIPTPIFRNINFIETQLGKVAATPLANDRFEYRFNCEKGSYLVAVTNKDGLYLNAKGLLSTPQKAILFTDPSDAEGMSNCMSYIHNIRVDIEKNGSTLKDSNLMSMSVAQLEKGLGKGKVVSLKQIFYHWNNFNLLEIVEPTTQMNKTLSGFPNETMTFNGKGQTSSEAIRILGQPQNVFVEELRQYEFTCSERPSTLYVIFNKNDLLLNVRGNDCFEQNCKAFKAIFKNSQVEELFNQHAAKQSRNSDAAASTTGTRF